jgi:glutaminyl-peptide cyclotransferase
MNRLMPVVLIILVFACKAKKPDPVAENLIPFTLVKTFPHDNTAFTQGLTIEYGRLFESTGKENSWISEVAITTGVQSKKVVLDPKFFGEGISILNNKVYQLTWQNKTGFIYDLNTFQKKGEFQYDHEGWGITHDGKNLIISDGTDKLHFLDTVTLKNVSTLSVTENGAKRDQLNELEFIEGFIYANQWQTNYILKIDPATGIVVGKMDLSSLANRIAEMSPQADVLNGIAYEKKSKTILITGKYWPALFALRFQDPAKGPVVAP